MSGPCRTLRLLSLWSLRPTFRTNRTKRRKSIPNFPFTTCPISSRSAKRRCFAFEASNTHANPRLQRKTQRAAHRRVHFIYISVSGRHIRRHSKVSARRETKSSQKSSLHLALEFSPCLIKRNDVFDGSARIEDPNLARRMLAVSRQPANRRRDLGRFFYEDGAQSFPVKTQVESGLPRKLRNFRFTIFVV
jgi:hypothetical protein